MESAPLELLNPTRKVLVQGIKERGETTAEELAGAAYLSVAAVRVHLNALERLGIVTHSNKRKGPGRPIHLYRLTEAGEELFPQGYAGFLRGVFGAISEMPGCEEQVIDFLEARQLEAAKRAVRSQDLPARLHELIESSSLQPFFPEIRKTGESSWCVLFRHCPVIQVAREYPSICALEQRIVQSVLGERFVVEAEELRPNGDANCSLIIRATAKQATALA